MQDSSVFRPIRKAFGPSKIKVIRARRREPKRSLKKLVYVDDDPWASISLTNSPIVPHRHPVINILIKLFVSESMFISLPCSISRKKSLLFYNLSRPQLCLFLYLLLYSRPLLCLFLYLRPLQTIRSSRPSGSIGTSYLNFSCFGVTAFAGLTV